MSGGGRVESEEGGARAKNPRKRKGSRRERRNAAAVDERRRWPRLPVGSGSGGGAKEGGSDLDLDLDLDPDMLLPLGGSGSDSEEEAAVRTIPLKVDFAACSPVWQNPLFLRVWHSPVAHSQLRSVGSVALLAGRPPSTLSCFRAACLRAWVEMAQQGD